MGLPSRQTGAIALLLLAAAGAARAEPEVRIGAIAGAVTYRESASIRPLRSRWDGPFVGLAGSGTFRFPESLVSLRLRGDLWTTPDRTEAWREDGERVQTNDLGVTGLSAGADLVLPLASEPGLRGLLGATWQFQNFRRDRFELRGRPDQIRTGRVDENVSVLALGGGAEADLPLGRGWTWRVGARADIVVWSEASNTALGTIRGDGGMLLTAESHLEWALGGDRRLFLGLGWHLQDLRGDSRDTTARLGPDLRIPVTIEWPDNRLTQLYAAGGLRLEF